MSVRRSRRDFLRGRVLPEPEPDAAAPPASDRPLPRVIAWLQDPPEPQPGPAAAGRHAAFPLMRPPGAIREDEFMRDCTRCAACIEACPHDALRPAADRYRGAAGTPVLDAARAPCRLCEDWPCIAACPEGVLELQQAGAMGTARVQVHDCLNALGSLCSVCLEQCPVPGALSLRGRAPVVNDALCTGCGVCHHVCPAPNNAIMLLPTRERPGRKPPSKGPADG
jgi:MauM/NapG family ferredoxin protein